MQNECYANCPYFQVNNFSDEYDNSICHYLDSTPLVIEMRKTHEPLCKKYTQKKTID